MHCSICVRSNKYGWVQVDHHLSLQRAVMELAKRALCCWVVLWRAGPACLCVCGGGGGNDFVVSYFNVNVSGIGGGVEELGCVFVNRGRSWGGAIMHPRDWRVIKHWLMTVMGCCRRGDANRTWHVRPPLFASFTLSHPPSLLCLTA